MKNQIILFLSIFLVLILIGCNNKDTESSSPQVFRFSESMIVDGLSRTYTLNLPPNYYESSGFSLVIAMHGGGGDAEQFENSSLLSGKANASGFIVVYPEGVKSTGVLKARTWNAGGCCDYAKDNAINDVKFISNLIDRLLASYKIDPKKVYATGHSNGGMMAYRLACELSGKIAAIAPNSCSMVVKNACNPSRSVPVLHMHSKLDTNVPYQGGYGTGVSGAYFPPIDSVLTVWSSINACTKPGNIIVDDSRYKFTKWNDCTNKVTIQYYLTNDGGHAWPGGLQGSNSGDTPSVVINANDLLWEFFQQYQLP